MSELITCKNCGTAFIGNFCNDCGEKVFHAHDKSMAHFFEESFHFITHLDNKFFRSLWLVFTRPAHISNDIIQGIRKKHFKPINLFLIGVILYLIFPFFQGLNMPLKSHMNEGYKPYTSYLVKKKMHNNHLTLEQVASKYDEKSPKIAKILLLIVIPLSGLVLALLFFKKKAYYFDHLTLAAELNTFNLYFTFFIMPLLLTIFLFIARLISQDIPFSIGDNITMPLYLLVFGIYCILAFVHFYKVKKVTAVWKSVLFLLLHMFILYFVYRIILLSVVFLFI